MVRLTQTLCKYLPDWYLVNKSGGAFFKKQAYFHMTRYMRGRAWNTPKNAVNRYHYLLKGEQHFGPLNSNIKRDIVRSRIAAACEEHDYAYQYLVATLPKIGIELNHHALATLAIYEPNSFKSLVEISKRAGQGEHDPFNLTI